MSPARQLDSLRRYLGGRAAPGNGGGRNVVVVAAGKGGVGASTAAALLAHAAAQSAPRVLLVDAAVGSGTLGLLLGVPAAPGLEALRGGVLLDEVATPLTPSLWFFPAAAEAEGPAERRALYRRAAADYDLFDLVVVDAGSRLGAVLDACQPGAARLLAVTTGERLACAAAYALLKCLGEKYPTLPLELLVNRGDATAPYAAVRAAAGGFLHRVVDLAGAIPEDDLLRATAEAGGDLAAMAAGDAGLAALPLAARVLSRASRADEGAGAPMPKV